MDATTHHTVKAEFYAGVDGLSRDFYGYLDLREMSQNEIAYN